MKIINENLIEWEEKEYVSVSGNDFSEGSDCDLCAFHSIFPDCRGVPCNFQSRKDHEEVYFVLKE